jgi:hypothetical protein
VGDEFEGGCPKASGQFIPDVAATNVNEATLHAAVMREKRSLVFKVEKSLTDD